MKVLISLISIVGTTLFFTCYSPNGNASQPKNEEASHQNYMSSVQKTAKSAHDMSIDYVSEANTIILQFAKEDPAPTGKVTFFSPTKAANNRTFELKTDPSKRMFIRIEGFEKGMWRIKVEWQGEDKVYEKEEKINLEPNDWARPIHK